MKEFKFNHEKNQQLKIIRGICFEDIIEKIKRDRQVKAIEHPNKKRYPKQRIFLVKIKNKIYAVPFIEESGYFFLKTIYPSEKYTKKLLKIK
ncbi:MAG: toxin [Patescibacteria group bacterium]